MSARPKAFLKHAKSKQKKEQKLDTADDFQAAGVEHEDAAGKWRAGDPVKSMRFFQRALEVYDQGLTRFPNSLDLAYNKARVQLEVATHPVLVRQLQIPVLDALQIALESHRYALALQQDNADSLFNTAQVLTSIAEEISKDDTRPDDGALQPLQEALELQARCLSLQELKYEEGQIERQQGQQQTEIQSNKNDIDDGGDDDDDDDEDEGGGATINSTTTSSEEQWFSIVEPVTIDTLVDTVLAQLDTLTTLCGILGGSPESAPPTTLAWIEEYSSNLLNNKIPLYMKQSSDQEREISLAWMAFTSSLLEAGLRMGKLDLQSYVREMQTLLQDNPSISASSAPPPPPTTKTTSTSTLPTPEEQLTTARIMISFNSCLVDFVSNTELDHYRWNLLNKAVTVLSAISKTGAGGVTNEEKMKSHFLRGDVSLLQHRMGQPPTDYKPAVVNSIQLLKNAETFYKNSIKLAVAAVGNSDHDNVGGDVEDDERERRQVAELRLAVVLALQNGSRRGDLEEELIRLQNRSNQKKKTWVKDQLDDMVVEGLIRQDFVSSLLPSLSTSSS